MIATSSSVSSAGANTLRFSTRPSLPESAANLLSISRPRPRPNHRGSARTSWLPGTLFLIDVILIWSFPDGPPAFVQALNVIVWASFAVVYVARLVWPVGKAMFVRTPSWTSSWSCCRCCGSCASSCSCVAAAFVSTEKIGAIVSIVIAVGIASAFFKWRLEHDAPGDHLPRRDLVGRRHHHHHSGLRRLHPGHRRRPDRSGERHRGSLFVTRQSEPGLLEMTCQRSSMHWEAAPPSHC
jgi:hypothetical protein